MVHAAAGTEPREHDVMVRAMFQRVLAAWAIDALSLRRRGLDRPGSRGAAQASDPAGRLSAAPARRVGWRV